MKPNETNLPNFIGIGGAKCATTWLSECLRYHPEVFMSSPKEIHFWDSKNDYKNGLDWYRNFFVKSGGHVAIGEFSPSYLMKQKAASQIFKALGPVKIIVSLRNPIDRFISHYKQYVRGGQLPEVSLLMDTVMVSNAIHKYPDLVNLGCYYTGVLRYYELFGSNNILVLFKENIDRDPQKNIRKLYRFLNVDENYLPPQIFKKVSGGIVPQYQFLEKLRIRLYAYSRAHMPFIIDIVRKHRLAEVYRKFNSKPSAILALDTDSISKLTSIYANEIHSLRKLLISNNITDLPSWLKNQ